MPPTTKREMPKFTPAPPELVALFQDAIRPLHEAEVKRMFSYPAAFAAGQMFACIFGDRVMLRLSPADRAEMAASGAKPFEPVAGRPMKEYVDIPDAILHDEAALDAWLRKAMAYAQSLPPKKEKKKKK